MTKQHDDDLRARRRGLEYRRFQWLHWLHTAAPDCEIAIEALGAIREQNPEFEPREHPDLNMWFSGTEAYLATSQWTVEALLQMPADRAIQEVLAYSPNERQLADGEHREAMLQNVNKATKTNPTWGLDLADRLIASGYWESDVWPHLLTAWGDSELELSDKQRLLKHLSADDLQCRHPRETAAVLTKLIQRVGESEVTELLNEANRISTALWKHTVNEDYPNITQYVGGVQQQDSWLQNAINHSSGQLALFWIYSTSRQKQQDPASQTFSVEFQSPLDAIIKEGSVSGQLGRTVLASQLNFFLSADETWALDNLLPLFDPAHKDFRCAWDGFLTWGTLSVPTVNCLRDCMIKSVSRVVSEFDDNTLNRFVEFYVIAMSWLIENATDEWITEFFKHADYRAKKRFAWKIGHYLRNSEETVQAEYWNRWLKDYWNNRLQGVPPPPPNNEEITEMLGWTVALPSVFPEAVEIATKMLPTAPLSQSLILDDISESGLADRYPTAMAELLVYLSKRQTEPWFWMGTQSVVDHLLGKDMPLDIEAGLRKLVATHRLN